ncbi:hypothetical protein CcCBS67573_g08609 [Chytriomyces confervae]|uniref:Uncharacterized protein n=1 Tax=Chytriomyces confervae TaxID=246404 RepID=A0A507EKH1_9FUNG|nr:hypothetical protein CcCBS67573_g08609 [Chytriomyces confervae]
MSNASLTGSIPASFGNLVNLVKLLLQHNNLSGHLPAGIGIHQKRETEQNNRNSQQTPSANLSPCGPVRNCQVPLVCRSLNDSLSSAYCSHAVVLVPSARWIRSASSARVPRAMAFSQVMFNYNGKLDHWITGDDRSLFHLARLQLSQTALTGIVPCCKELCDSPSGPKGTQIFLPEDTAASNRKGNLNLSYNTVSGPFPDSSSQLVSMHALNSSHKLFTGCIQDLMSCSNHSLLQPQHNGFGIWKLLGVLLLNLRHNCFGGAIPESIAHSGRIYFPILRHSYRNALEGFTGPVSKRFIAGIFRKVEVDDSALLQLIILQLDPFKTAKYRRVCRSFNSVLTGSPFSNLVGLAHIGRTNGGSKVFCFVTPETFGEAFLTMAQNHVEDLDKNGNTVRKYTKYPINNLEVLPINPRKTINEVSLFDFLKGHILSGPLPPALGNMTKLTNNVYLKGSCLTGPLPSELGNLVQLKILNLSRTLLDGEIPDSFGNLVNLEVLDMSHASLTGCIPESLGNLENLIKLNLQNNKLSGTLPDMFGGMAKLQTLSLDRNHLEGPIPESLGPLPESIFRLPLLQGANFKSNLILSENPSTCDASVEVVTSIDLSSLNVASNPVQEGNASLLLSNLDLSDNQLSGKLPNYITSLTSLRYLFLQENNLTGPLPTEIAELSCLWTLDLGSNQISGTIPDSITSLANLRSLSLQRNRLSGCLPTEIGLLTSLYDLDLSHNQLCGGIPESIGRLRNLNFLDLSHNELTGEIPPAVFMLHNMDSLHLNNNSFVGSLHPDIEALADLVALDLSHNQLTGTLPDRAFLQWGLKKLKLNHNRLSGPLPKFGEGEFIQTLHLDHNQFSGQIPAHMGDLKHLKSLNLSHNQLLGPLPAFMSRYQFIEGLDLSNNNFSGSLPCELLKNMTQIKKLDLSNNQFSGLVHNILNTCSTLDLLDLSSNHFDGDLPERFRKQPADRPVIPFRWETETESRPSDAWQAKSHLEIPGVSEALALSFDTRADTTDAVNPDFVYSSAKSFLLPSVLGNLVNLKNLNLSLTQVNGTISDSFGNLVNLEMQNMSHARLAGWLGSCESWELGQTKIMSLVNLLGPDTPCLSKGDMQRWTKADGLLLSELLLSLRAIISRAKEFPHLLRDVVTPTIQKLFTWLLQKVASSESNSDIVHHTLSEYIVLGSVFPSMTKPFTDKIEGICVQTLSSENVSPRLQAQAIKAPVVAIAGSVQLAYAKLIVKCLQCHARDEYPMEWVASGLRSLVVAVAVADAELKPRLEELIHAHSDVLFGYRPVISRTVIPDTEEANPGFGGTYAQGGVTGGRIYASVLHSEIDSEKYDAHDHQARSISANATSSKSANVISASKTLVNSVNSSKSAPIPSAESVEESTEDMDFMPAPVEKPKTAAPPVFKFPVGRSEPQIEPHAKTEAALSLIYKALLENVDKIQQEDRADIEAVTKLAESGVLSQQLVKRLGLSGSKFADIVHSVNDIEMMDDPVGKTTLATRLDDGLDLYKVSCPTNAGFKIRALRVVVNIAALALKSGNAVILKGGKEAAKSNAILSIINDALSQSKTISKDAVLLVESRTAIDELLKLDRYIDLVIPRGSNALVRHFQGSTRIPVLGHADGICATYLDEKLDPEMAIRVLIDAKTSAPNACNSTETLLIHESHISTPFFGSLVKKLTEAGIQSATMLL